MGTSTSFRSPATPKWNAVKTSLRHAEPIPRIRSELFNAGADWAKSLGSTSVTTYVKALIDAYENLPSLLQEQREPSEAIRHVVEQTRDQALMEETNEAVALAERAFHIVLLKTASQDVSLVDTTSSDAIDAWTRQRGLRPRDLVDTFLRETLSQFVKHALARDVADIKRTAEGRTGLKELTASLLQDVSTTLSSSLIPLSDEHAIVDSWSDLVRSAFEQAAVLPDVADE